jgi:hypothetical protein
MLLKFQTEFMTEIVIFTSESRKQLQPVWLQASLLRRIRQTVTWDISNSRLARHVDFLGLLVKDSRTRSTVSGDAGDCPGLPVLFAAHKQSVSSNFLYYSLIVLSVGGSIWYLVRKPRRTVIMDSVLASCKTKKGLCSPENAMLSHYCLQVEKRATKPRLKTQENSIIYSFHWHALVPCGRVCLWAADLRNPGGNNETRCIKNKHHNEENTPKKGWIVYTYFGHGTKHRRNIYGHWHQNSP